MAGKRPVSGPLLKENKKALCKTVVTEIQINPTRLLGTDLGDLARRKRLGRAWLPIRESLGGADLTRVVPRSSHSTRRS